MSEKFDEISQLIWRLLSRFQINWEIPSTFVAFLENLNFINIIFKQHDFVKKMEIFKMKRL